MRACAGKGAFLGSLFCLILSADVLAGSEEASIYEKRKTWEETMLAVRENWRRIAKKRSHVTLESSDWHSTAPLEADQFAHQHLRRGPVMHYLEAVLAEW